MADPRLHTMSAHESTGENGPVNGKGTASQPRAASPENTQVADLPDICATVDAHLAELVDGVTYLKAADIHSRLGLTVQQTGTAMGHLADAADASVAIERWSQTHRGVTWRLEPEGSA